MNIQCATCSREPEITALFHHLWPDMQEFNENYGRYQDAARIHKCKEYQCKFGRRTGQQELV
jgi:hypothetical protein